MCSARCDLAVSIRHTDDCSRPRLSASRCWVIPAPHRTPATPHAPHPCRSSRCSPGVRGASADLETGGWDSGPMKAQYHRARTARQQSNVEDRGRSVLSAYGWNLTADFDQRGSAVGTTAPNRSMTALQMETIVSKSAPPFRQRSPDLESDFLKPVSKVPGRRALFSFFLPAVFPLWILLQSVAIYPQKHAKIRTIAQEGSHAKQAKE